MSTTALTKIEGALARAPIQKVEDLRASFEQLRQMRVNVVCPVTSIDAIMPMHAVAIRAVVIDPAVDNKGNGPEVYQSGVFCKDNERALGRVAIGKIAAAAGVVTLSRRRLDDRSERYYCEIEVTRGFREFDGTWRQETKAKAIDLRDGSAGANELAGKPGMLAQARIRIQELCETKASLRVDRVLLNLRQKYTVNELAQPFAVPKLIPMLNPNDPDQKRALLDMATGREASLFGPQPSEASRTTKDVTPPLPANALPALEQGPGTKPPPVGAVPASNGNDDDEDLGDVIDLSEETAPIVCRCTACGGGLCQEQVSEEDAQAAHEAFGVEGRPIAESARCRKACFPTARSFDFKRPGHDNDNAVLGLPKFPKLTVGGLREKLAAAKKK